MNADRAVDFPDGVPELLDTVTGLRLRALAEDDLLAVVEQSQDPETAHWTTVPQPYGLADARAFLHQVHATGWRSGTQAGFAIEAPSEGAARFAGLVELRHTGPGQAEVGFALHPTARGRGIMSNALRLVLSWAFATQGILVVRWYAAVGNVASWRAAKAAGFRYEGVGRLRVPLRSGLVDGWMASATAADLASLGLTGRPGSR